MRAIRSFARPYRSILVGGCLWTVGVVLCRLAMPWPLRGVVEIVFPDEPSGSATLVGYLPAYGNPVLWLGLLYLACATAAGFTEMAQRIAMMKFSARTIHDLRGAAVAGAARQATRGQRTGDLIARVIGDAARIKAGMAGILVHVTQNGLLFLGVCAVFLHISPLLGLFFLAAGFLAVAIGWRASGSVGRSADKHRRMEGDFAATLEEAVAQGDLDVDAEDLNLGSARKDVTTTRLITRSTLLIHVVLAGTVALALWVGAAQVAAGSLAPGDIFLFIAYALTVHRRTVQVGRQTARSGKVLACANRLAVLLQAQDQTPAEGNIGALTEELRLERVKLRSARSRGHRARLKRTNLAIRAGEHVAVLGGIGSGKSMLLRLLAGMEPKHRGTIRWDAAAIPDAGQLRASVGYVSQDPVFPTQPLWRTLGLSGPDSLSPQQEAVLKSVGIERLVRRLSKGLNTKLGSNDVTGNEARLLALSALVIRNRTPVWVLDCPLDGLTRGAARRCLDGLLAAAEDRTLIIALSRPVDLDRFDRVIGMRKGRVVFDGSPARWRADRRAKKEAVACEQ